MTSGTGVETGWLMHAVKNASAGRGCMEFWGPEGPGEVERAMSLRIAVALAAIIGAGTLVSTQAEARADMVGFRGDYSRGTIVIKTNERRLYLVVDPGHAVRYPVGVGKSGK